MSSAIYWAILIGAFLVTVTAVTRASRAHEWVWLGAILAGWFLLGGAVGLGWVVAVVYLLSRLQMRDPDASEPDVLDSEPDGG